MQQTPLYTRHRESGAKTADFGGWEMPIEYQGVVAEHNAVRTGVGIFDVSHMGKVRIHGPGSVAFLNSVLTNDLDRIGAGQAQYSMLCNPKGGVIDDLIVYRWSDDEVFLVPNASNARTVVDSLRVVAPAGVEVVDHHGDYGIIAVQGPLSANVLAALGLPFDHEYMTMVAWQFNGLPIVVARTGYTGEHGYELVAPVAVLGDLWDTLLGPSDRIGVVRAGLGARDTLRTEMGYALHGHELSPVISPVQAGLSWAVGWDKPVFAGREALLSERAAGPALRLRGVLALDRGIPRPHMQVRRVCAEPLRGELMGEVTSGTFSPTLKLGLGLALVDASIHVDDVIVIDIRGRESRFKVVKTPFVTTNPRSQNR